MADLAKATKVKPRDRAVPQVQWDDSQMQSSYANVCNAVSTREEFVLFFGTNQAWKGDEEAVTVRLSDRIILSPFAAKRLLAILTNVVSQYEKRFGALGVTGQIPTPTGND
jgi:hypothetical protein